MHVRWTDPAVRDLTHICDYIEEHNSSTTARRVALSIYERVSALVEFPERGRQGRKSGTRELIFTGLPYLAIYRIRGGWPTLESGKSFWVAHPCGFCKGGSRKN